MDIIGKKTMTYEQKQKLTLDSLQKINIPENSFIYSPCNSKHRVTEIVKTSGRPMPSAAKCPIWVTFKCTKFKGLDAMMKEKKGKGS